MRNPILVGALLGLSGVLLVTFPVLGPGTLVAQENRNKTVELVPLPTKERELIDAALALIDQGNKVLERLRRKYGDSSFDRGTAQYSLCYEKQETFVWFQKDSVVIERTHLGNTCEPIYLDGEDDDQ